MVSTLFVPELGENVDSVDVVTVLVSAGDTVTAGQAMIEVETEKAAVEIPAEVDGTITEVHVAAGDSLTAGDKIVTMEGSDAPAAAVPDPNPVPNPDSVPDPDPDPDPDPVPVPDPDPDPDPDPVPVPDPDPVPVPDPDPDPVPVPVPDPVPETTPAHPEEPPPPEPSSHALAPRWQPGPEPPQLVPAAPSVRRFAREVGVDITQVKGTGPGGRLSIDDIKEHTRQRLSAGAGAATPTPELPDFSRWGAISEEKASKIRRVTAERMARAWRTVPQVTNHDQADITRLEEVRKAFRGRVEQAGGRLTLTAILVKVMASALKVFPELNSSFDPDRGMVIHKAYFNVGVAVDTDRGLLVPVLKDADRKNVTELAVELDDMAARARDRKLQPAEMEGATFTISNLGGIGGTGFTPIVNWPEVGILGVSRGAWQPVWNGSDFEARLMLPLSLSYDHRLVDGATAARFLHWTTEALEEPLLLALEG